MSKCESSYIARLSCNQMVDGYYLPWTFIRYTRHIPILGQHVALCARARRWVTRVGETQAHAHTYAHTRTHSPCTRQLFVPLERSISHIGRNWETRQFVWLTAGSLTMPFFRIYFRFFFSFFILFVLFVAWKWCTMYLHTLMRHFPLLSTHILHTHTQSISVESLNHFYLDEIQLFASVSLACR